jgi:hypothetical protein
LARVVRGARLVLNDDDTFRRRSPAVEARELRDEARPIVTEDIIRMSQYDAFESAAALECEGLF